MPIREIRIGVGTLLGILFHPKDLSAGFAAAASRAQEGIEGHQLVSSRRPPEYRAEVPIEYAFDWQGYRLLVRGRADGLTEDEGGLAVEEVKTTYAPLGALTPNPVHEAQLRLYLFFLMEANPGRRVTGRLTYLNLHDLAERSFEVAISHAEGRQFFLSLALPFLIGERDRDDWRQTRNASLAALAFPFPERRPGQDDLMEAVREAVTQEKDLLAEAATGIGKTISVLYPALKRLAESERYTQIFFLTAKTAGKAILRATLERAREEGLRLRTVFIEAKERVCLSPGSECDPETCPYAVDYYAKAARAMPQLLREEMVTPEAVRERATRDQLCPFELSLDLSLLADLVVCDYNYVFDPRVYLRRFFLWPGRQDFLFLVDEAHNLVTRGREMYSATLAERPVAEAAAAVQGHDDELARSYLALEEHLGAWRREMDGEGRPGTLLSSLPETLQPAAASVLALEERFLTAQPRGPIWQRVRELHWELVAFARVAAGVNEHYALYVKAEGRWTNLRLLCLNPGPLLRQRLNRGRAAVFFSATLSPYDYFRELLGAHADALSIRLPSPFLPENRLYLHVPGIDTRYKARERSLPALAQCAADLVTAHLGNYLIFFPSYSYLNAVSAHFRELVEGQAAVYIQFPSMSEAHKAQFLRKVTAPVRERSHVGLAVLGGLFGEAVDLPGDQLVGVLIAGPGLPMVSDEQELIRRYFEERNGQGFLYAYLIPGLIRVIQSAGRVFRTPEDRGVVMLLDDRFADERTRELLPPDWFQSGREFTVEEYQETLKAFWGE